MTTMKEVVEQLKPSWTHRRAYVKTLMVYLCVMLTTSLFGSLALAAFGKFGAYISVFLVVFAICNFAVLLGIIGSYIFGSRWETKDFLDILPNIIPQVNGISVDQDSDSSLGSLEDYLQNNIPEK